MTQPLGVIHGAPEGGRDRAFRAFPNMKSQGKKAKVSARPPCLFSLEDYIYPQETLKRLLFSGAFLRPHPTPRTSLSTAIVQIQVIPSQDQGFSQVTAGLEQSQPETQGFGPVPPSALLQYPLLLACLTQLSALFYLVPAD